MTVSMMRGPEEREVKLRVPEDFHLPQLASGADVSVVDRGETLLEAAYWDTADLALAGAGVGFRHRNGTWTFKGRSRREADSVVREELEIDGDAQTIPAPIVERLREYANVADLGVVAQLVTRRHQFDVTREGESAEVVHDRVTVRDGMRDVTSFAEVEVEYPAGSAALARAVVALLVAGGAVVDGTAKYVRALRALGHQPPQLG